MKFRIESTLWNQDAALSTLWSTIQQLVVASSTYFIMRTLQLATDGNFQGALLQASLFVASLVLVYLPNTLSMVYLQRWRLSSVDQFFRGFVAHNKGRAPLGHKSFKAQSESWLTNECLAVYDQATNLLYQLYSTLTNALFSVIVIAWVLDFRILAWYLLAGLVLVGANLAFKSKISHVSIGLQASRKDLSSTLLLAWDNIFIGNRHNFGIWIQRFQQDLELSKKAHARYDLVRSMVSSGTVSVALLVVAAGNLIFLKENQSSLPIVAGLLATLPRQLQIIQSIFSFFNLSLAWTGAYQQLKELEAVINPGSLVQTESFIRPKEIEFSQGAQSLSWESASDLMNQIQLIESGRWTLRGRNGAGKSTLLTLMKEQLGEEAFLLPSHYAELCFNSPNSQHSDGNRLLATFKEILDLRDVKYVLLDEWDANLDGENLQRMNLVIQALAEVKVVVESRHRIEKVPVKKVPGTFLST